MALLITDCPHCLTSKSGMVIFGIRSVPIEQAEEVTARTTASPPTYQWDVAVAAACQSCFKPVCAMLRTPYKHNRHEHPSAVTTASKALTGDSNTDSLGFRVKEIWPVGEPATIPEHLPETVAKAFRSAETNYRMPDGEDAAAMLYRRAIDVAIREKHPEIKGLLAVRIAKLVDAGLLPPAMKDWADQIRLIGNDGAHEPDGVTVEDLTPMRGFTEAFLRYFMTIPFEVALRRGQIDADGNPTA
jgi:hypothetical protein